MPRAGDGIHDEARRAKRMARKSDKELRKRIAKLHRRGVEPALDQGVTVAELLDVIGDLTPYEVKELVDLAEMDHNALIMNGDARPISEVRAAIAAERGLRLHPDDEGENVE
jgi:hypothetical protein